jgi:hypothetical protein
MRYVYCADGPISEKLAASLPWQVGNGYVLGNCKPEDLDDHADPRKEERRDGGPLINSIGSGRLPLQNRASEPGNWR